MNKCREIIKKMSCPLPGYPGGGQLIFLYCKAVECARAIRVTGRGVHSDAFAGLPDGLWRSPIDMGNRRGLSGPVLCIASMSAAML